MGVAPRACSSTPARSANLLALTALTSPQLGERRLRPGDEVITVRRRLPHHGQPDPPEPARARCSSTCTSPPTTSTCRRLEEALGPRTRAIMIAHTLGNPFDLDAVVELRRASTTCGWSRTPATPSASTLPGPARWARFGDLATVSFYPAHHITMGEGGAVAHRATRRSRSSSSRSATGAATAGASRARTTPAASASTGSSATCPHGYDHKYTYSHIGYNLKLTDMQAAVGRRPAREAARVHRGAARATSTGFAQALEPLADAAAPARGDARQASRAGSGSRSRCATTAPLSRNALVEQLESAAHRHPAALRRQPAAPAGVSGHRAPGGGNAGRARTG